MVQRNTYESILKQASNHDLKMLASQGRAWYRSLTRDLKKARINRYQFIVRGKQDTVRRLEIGKMYFFEYVPKYSGFAEKINQNQILPVFDRYPLVLPFNTTTQGFVAINLHYLPIKARAWLLDKLLFTADHPSNRLRLSWGLLSRFSRLQLGQYATHQYLIDHITSPFRLVRIDDYAKAIMLPFAGWYGKDKRLVNRFKRMN